MRHALNSGGEHEVTSSRKRFFIRSVAPLGCAALFLFSGCTYDRYSSPHGGSFTRLAVGNKTQITSLDVEAQTNGLPTLHLKGYKNDQAQSVEAISQGVTQGVIKAVTGK